MLSYDVYKLVVFFKTNPSFAFTWMCTLVTLYMCQNSVVHYMINSNTYQIPMAGRAVFHHLHLDLQCYPIPAAVGGNTGTPPCNPWWLPGTQKPVARKRYMYLEMNNTIMRRGRGGGCHDTWLVLSLLLWIMIPPPSQVNYVHKSHSTWPGITNVNVDHINMLYI